MASGTSVSSVFSAGAAVQWDFEHGVPGAIRRKAEARRGGSEQGHDGRFHGSGDVDGRAVVGEEQIASGQQGRGFPEGELARGDKGSVRGSSGDFLAQPTIGSASNEDYLDSVFHQAVGDLGKGFEGPSFGGPDGSGSEDHHRPALLPFRISDFRFRYH